MLYWKTRSLIWANSDDYTIHTDVWKISVIKNKFLTFHQIKLRKKLGTCEQKSK